MHVTGTFAGQVSVHGDDPMPELNLGVVKKKKPGLTERKSSVNAVAARRARRKSLAAGLEPTAMAAQASKLKALDETPTTPKYEGRRRRELAEGGLSPPFPGHLQHQLKLGKLPFKVSMTPWPDLARTLLSVSRIPP